MSRGQRYLLMSLAVIALAWCGVKALDRHFQARTPNAYEPPCHTGQYLSFVNDKIVCITSTPRDVPPPTNADVLAADPPYRISEPISIRGTKVKDMSDNAVPISSISMAAPMKQSFVFTMNGVALLTFTPDGKVVASPELKPDETAKQVLDIIIKQWPTVCHGR